MPNLCDCVTTGCRRLLLTAAVASVSLIAGAQQHAGSVPPLPTLSTDPMESPNLLPGTDAALNQARELVNTGHLSEAEAQVRAWLGTHAGSPDNMAAGHLLLALILFRQDRPVPSLAEYTAASRLGPTSAQELQYVALDYVLLKDYPDADKWMTRATTWTPQDPEAWYRLGRIKYSEDRPLDAEACFLKALAISPRLVKAENNLGLAYEALNRKQDAVAAYRNAIAWQADAPHPSEQPLLNLGLLYLQQNHAQAAIPLLEQARTLAPDDAAIRVGLGRAYEQQNQPVAAQAELEKAVALDPGSAADHFLLGRLYRKAGLADRARAEFARAAQIDGTHSSN